MLDLLALIAFLGLTVFVVCVGIGAVRAYVYFGFERSRKRHHWGSHR